jgi:hypothetical protein
MSSGTELLVRHDTSENFLITFHTVDEEFVQYPVQIG